MKTKYEYYCEARAKAPLFTLALTAEELELVSGALAEYHEMLSKRVASGEKGYAGMLPAYTEKVKLTWHKVYDCHSNAEERVETLAKNLRADDIAAARESALVKARAARSAKAALRSAGLKSV